MVVVPTCCPARSRMWVMSRVTVDLPLVPVIETIGIRRSASRIHDGGVARAAAIRSRPRVEDQRCWVPVRRTRRPGATDRSARSNAASAMSRDRSAPAHGQVTIQRPASDARWTITGPLVLAVVRAQAARPGDEVGDVVGPVAGRDRPAEVDERAARRRPRALPRPPAAHRDLDLDHRHEPVDVGALEQADLDESHGPATIREPIGDATDVPGGVDPLVR